MYKIFIIIGGLEIGGTEKQLLLKLRYLKEKYKFTVIIFYKKGELFDEFKKSGIEIIDLTSKIKFKPFKYLKIICKIFFLLKNLKPKIVNFYLPHSYLLAGPLSFLFKKIIFIMSRRSLNNYQKKIPFIKFFEKILHKRMNFILANSKAIVNQLILDERVKKEKVKLIYNSVELPRRIRLKKEGKIRILFLANLIPYKNHKLILKVCNELKDLNNFKIDFIGGGSLAYVNDLKKMSLNLNVNKKINFWGKLKDYEKLARIADIGILASDEEGFSNAILEYFSFGLPVVVTKVGGNSEIVEHNKNGYLVEKNDCAAFSKYLKKLILSKTLRKKFGKEAFDKVKNDFEIKKNIEKYDNFYQTLLS